MKSDEGRTKTAGIMAGGNGRRISSVAPSKPLAKVNGIPLIDHVVEQCIQAGVTTIAIALSADDERLADYLQAIRCSKYELLVVRTPPGCGTGVTVYSLVTAIGAKGCLISTVDTIARPGTYRRFLEFSESLPIGTAGTFLVTSYVHDDDPIWVLADGDGKVSALEKGREPTGIVFANVRWLAPKTCEAISIMTAANGTRDTVMMNRLIHEKDADFRVYLENPVFDIDTPSDLDAACIWLRDNGGTVRLG